MNYNGLTFLGSLRHGRQVLCSQECCNRGMTQNIRQLKALGQRGGRNRVQSVTPEDRKFEDSRSEGWAEVGKGRPKDCVRQSSKYILFSSACGLDGRRRRTAED